MKLFLHSFSAGQAFNLSMAGMSVLECVRSKDRHQKLSSSACMSHTDAGVSYAAAKLKGCSFKTS